MRRDPSSLVLTLVLLAPACLSKRTIGIPDEAPKSVVVLLERDVIEEAYVFDTATGHEITVSDDPSAKVFVLTYNCPPDRLGLVSEPDGRLAIGGPSPGPLPTPHSVFRVRGTSDPTRVDPTPPEIGTLLVSVKNPSQCAHFIEHHVTVPLAMTDILRYVFPIDSNRALVIGEHYGQTQFFEASRSAGSVTLTLTSTSDGLIVEGPIYRSPITGELWFADADGVLQRGTPPGPFTVAETATIARGEQGIWMDGPHDQSPFELFALLSSGPIYSFNSTTSTAWQSVQRATSCARPRTCIGTVFWIGPSQYLIGVPNSAGLLRYDAGMIDTRLFEDVAVEARIFASAPNHMIYAGGSDAFSAIWKSADQGLSWSRVSDILPADIEAILPTMDGRVFYVRDGGLRQLTELGTPECEPMTLGRHVVAAAILGTSMLFTTTNAGTADVQVFLIDIMDDAPMDSTQCN